MVQFHQSYSYEDFIQGFRPSGQGFRLKNGLFYEFCEAARNDPGFSYVFVIDEINRGNLSKVFGEAMMLIEPDKRGPEWAIPLAYSETGEERFYVPDNLYLIGLMNTADRSLAMVDYALRRRFGFVDLTPQFDSDEFREYLGERGADAAFVETVVARMTGLNDRIAADLGNLGPGYRIGHSFFCSIAAGTKLDWTWYRSVIEGDVGPLLREYYFDDPRKADALVEELLRRD
jgi:5-methylcytosine-specific restriction protein B